MATIGHAYFKLLPSLQGLGREIRDQVRQSERDAPAVTLTAQVQTALLKEQIRAAAREGNDSAVRLLAELDALPAETRFQRLVREMSGKSVVIKAVADKSINSTVRGLGELEGGLNRTTAQFTRMTLSVGASVFKYAALAAAVGQAVSLLGGLGSVAATASGSLLLVPAAGLAAATAITTLKLGIAGFSDAIKESDPAKYAEAIKDFPPSMAEAANAARALRPELTGLRQTVQQRLFAGLAGEITGLAGTYFPLLRTELGRVASGLNAGTRGFGAFAREGRTVNDVRAILDNTSQSLSAAASGVRPLLQAFRDIAAVGSSFLPGFGSGLADGAEKFAAFIAEARKSGQLRQWLSAGLSAVGDLVTVVGNLAKTFGAVFSAANASGSGLLSMLVEVTGQVLAFVRSAEGSAALTQIFTGLHAIAAGLLPVLAAIGQAVVTSIAPAIGQLGPIIGQAFASLAPAIAPLGQALAAMAPVLGAAAQALAAVLVPALAALSPIVSALAPVLATIVGQLGGALGSAVATLTPALVELAKTLAPLIAGFGGLLVQALQLAAPAVTELAAVLTPFVAQFGGALLDALRAVMPVISALSELFTSVLLEALKAVTPLLPVIVSVVRQLAGIIGGALAAATPVLTQLAGLLGQIAGQILSALLPILPPLAQAFVSIVTALLPLAPPLLQIVSALLPPLLDLLSSLLPIITDGAALFASLATAILPLVQTIVDLLMPAIQSLFDLAQPIFAAIVSVVSGAMRAVKGVIDVVMGLLSGDWGQAWQGIKDVAGGIWSAIKGVVSDGIGGVLDWIRFLPGKIVDLLSNVGSLLVDAGKNIIRGLIDGLTAGFRWVKDKLGQLTSWITDWKGPPARDRILLTANGRLIMGGLLAGLEDGEPQIRDYLTGLTDALPLEVSGTVTASSAARSAGPSALPPQTALSQPAGSDRDADSCVTVVIDASGLDRHLTAWLRSAVHAQGGGNVQLAFGY